MKANKESKHELQKDDFILPGDLGNVIIGSTGEKRKVTKISANKKDGSVTISISKVVDHYLNGITVTEDAEFEVIQPKQISDKP